MGFLINILLIVSMVFRPHCKTMEVAKYLQQDEILRFHPSNKQTNCALNLKSNKEYLMTPLIVFCTLLYLIPIQLKNIKM